MMKRFFSNFRTSLKKHSLYALNVDFGYDLNSLKNKFFLTAEYPMQ